MADEPDLEQGAQGEWVTYLQQMLQHLGVLSEAPSGTFDDSTRQAVVAAQQHYGIDEDGKVSEKTWKLLAQVQAGQDAKAGFEQGEREVATVDAPEMESGAESGGDTEGTA